MQDTDNPTATSRTQTVGTLQDRLKAEFEPSISDTSRPSAGAATSAGQRSALDWRAANARAAGSGPTYTATDLSGAQAEAARLAIDAAQTPHTPPPTAPEIAIAPPAASSGQDQHTDRLVGWLLNSRQKNVDPHSTAPRLPATIYMSSFFINMLGLALPVVILQVYDRVMPNQATATLSFLIFGLLGVVILDAAMKIARAYMVGWITARHEYGVWTDALNGILYADSSKIEAEAPSVHVDRLNALDAMREFYGGQSRLLLLDLPFVVIFLGLMAFIGGYLVLVPIVLFVALAAVSLFRGRALRAVLENRSQHDDRRYDFIIESLMGIETVKTMAMEPQIQRRFERLQKIGATASHETILLGNQVQSLGVLFSNLTMISVVTVGAVMVINGPLTMGTLAACTLLSGRTIQPLLKGLGLWTQLQRLSVARDQVTKLFAYQPQTAQHGLMPAELSGAVNLTDVGFAYDAGAPAILSNINLHVAPGEMIGLRGGDGSGKSTLMKLIRGDIRPTAGSVKLDAYDPALVARESIINAIAYVPPHASVMRGTIMENLTMFRGGEAIDHAREAARLIGLETDINRLPAGYDMQLSEGITEELPVGLMQRIVIARALARKPKILLFDEGNANLDSNSDAQLRDGLERLKGRTTIVIASLRPSLLRLTDRVYSLLDGNLYDISGEYADPAPAAPVAPSAPATPAAAAHDVKAAS